jgi:hypothetical protein
VAKKEYPGDLDDFARLREMRESLEKQHADGSLLDVAPVLAANIAEQIAGLTYILDGIRYSARKQS